MKPRTAYVFVPQVPERMFHTFTWLQSLSGLTSNRHSRR
jgi:hypothetical protein